MSFQLKRCFFKFHERLYHYRKHFKSNYGNILTVRYFSLPQPKQNHNRTNDDQNRGYAHQFWCRVRPYYYLARIDKSVGTMLLLWPCVWGTSLATEMGHVPDIILLSKFAVGAFVMRGAGCVINDLWDRDFDKHVERTKLRPLASGEVTVAEALVFLFGQLSCGLLILVSFNYSTIVWGFASMPLVIAYPLMKRFTNWPQLVLGLTFNWGVIVGWTAVQGSLSLLPVLPLYFSGVCWTLVYDTLYGYQDREDDKKLGRPVITLIQ
jgi:4-hydroxybenzoate polyprenyltransferase